MYAAFPRSEYYNGAAPPAPSVGVVPNGRRWFPRSRVFGRRVRHSAVPLRHRQRLRRRPSPWPPDPDRIDPIGSSPSVVVDGQICAATQPTSTGLELVRPSRGVTTPIPRVYLPVSLTAPGPSGSTGPTRLCRGCSHPPRRPPDRIASSFTLPLRRQGDGRSFTSIRNTRASWRNYGRLTRVPTSVLWTLTGFPRSPHARYDRVRVPPLRRGQRCSHDRLALPGRRLPLLCGQALYPGPASISRG
jgi:hypothetical protein